MKEVRYILALISLYVVVLLTCLVHITWAGPIDELEQNTVMIPNGTAAVVRNGFGHKFLVSAWHVCNHYKGGPIPVMKDNKIIGTADYEASSVQMDVCVLTFDTKLPGLLVARKFNSKASIYGKGYPYNPFLNKRIATHYDGMVRRFTRWYYEIPAAAFGGDCPIGSERQYLQGMLTACGVQYDTAMTSFNTAPGASGGPVINDEGDLVGVIQSASEDGGGIIPLSTFREYLEQF